MRTLGIRELRDSLSEVLRQVAEDGEIVEITKHGRVVARVVPAARPQLTQEEISALIADMDQAAAELGAVWPAGVSAQDAIDDVRS